LQRVEFGTVRQAGGPPRQEELDRALAFLREHEHPLADVLTGAELEKGIEAVLRR
jgi:hypothetical protein